MKINLRKAIDLSFLIGLLLFYFKIKKFPLYNFDNFLEYRNRKSCTANCVSFDLIEIFLEYQSKSKK